MLWFRLLFFLCCVVYSWHFQSHSYHSVLGNLLMYIFIFLNIVPFIVFFLEKTLRQPGLLLWFLYFFPIVHLLSFWSTYWELLSSRTSIECLIWTIMLLISKTCSCSLNSTLVKYILFMFHRNKIISSVQRFFWLFPLFPKLSASSNFFFLFWSYSCWKLYSNVCWSLATKMRCNVLSIHNALMGSWRVGYVRGSCCLGFTVINRGVSWDIFVAGISKDICRAFFWSYSPPPQNLLVSSEGIRLTANIWGMA